MKTKIHKWASLALILSALVTLSVVAFATDGYTEAGTVQELIAALNGGAGKIRLTDDVYAIEGDASHITVSRDLELDLNDHTLGGFTLGTAPGESGTPAVAISNGYLTFGDNDSCIISHESGSLTLTNIVMNGKLCLGAGTTTAIEGCTITRTAPNPEGSYLNGDYSAIQFLENWDSDYARITSIKDSTIIGYYLGVNMAFGSIDSITGSYIEGMAGSGITVTTFVDQTSPSTISGISECRIVGGEDAPAIKLQAGRAEDENASFIGFISASSLIGGIDGGTITSISVSAGNSVDSITNAAITDGIFNAGTISTIENCDIYQEHTAIDNRGTITSLTGCTLRADSDYGKGIENLGTINAISGCSFETILSSLHNHPSGHMGSVTGNTFNTMVTNGGTIDALTGNTFTIPEEGAIDNTWWGEDNPGVITVCENNTFADTEAAAYTMQFARQIRLYEPWGVRVSVMVDANGAALELKDNSAIDAIGIYFLQGGAQPAQDALAENGTWVAGEYNELLSTTQDVFSSDFIGIQTNKLDETVYYMACLKMADGSTVYSEVRSLSVLDLLNAGVNNVNMSAAERGVYSAIINWFYAYEAYLND